MTGDPNNAIQSLSLIAQAASRLMAHMHWSDALVDPDEEIGHMRANLNHVEDLIKEAPGDH